MIMLYYVLFISHLIPNAYFKPTSHPHPHFLQIFTCFFPNCMLILSRIERLTYPVDTLVRVDAAAKGEHPMFRKTEGILFRLSRDKKAPSCTTKTNQHHDIRNILKGE